MEKQILHLDVFGFDLHTELQINVTPRGKSKIQMSLNHYTPAGLELICYVQRCNTFFRQKFVGKVPQQLAVPALPGTSFYAFTSLKKNI